jgi:hypothetical protein
MGFHRLAFIGVAIYGLASAAGCAGQGQGGGQNGGSGGGSGAGGAGGGGGSGGTSAGAGGGGGGGGAGGDSDSGAGGSTAGAGGGGGAGGGFGGGGGAVLCGAPGLILCDSFDTDTLGALPPAPPWMAKDTGCSDTTHVLKVDNTVSKSPSNALVSSAIPYDACSLHADLGTPSDFWVRAWVYFAQGDFTFHEVTAFELAPAADTDDPEIRVGFRGDSSCQPTGVEVNITGAAGGEQTGCSGFKPQADTWYCFELHVTQTAGSSGQNVTADLSIDGQDLSYSNHGTPIDVVTGNGISGAIRYLKVGARSYSSAYMHPIYVDDLAVGPQRLGCP